MSDKQQLDNPQQGPGEERQEEPRQQTPDEAKEELCKLLYKARLESGRDIEYIAHEMNVPISTVSGMESGAIYEDMRKVFVRGYLTNYGKILGLDKEPLLELLNRIYSEKPSEISKAGKGGYITTDYEKREMVHKEKKELARIVIPLILVVLVFGALFYWKLVLDVTDISASTNDSGNQAATSNVYNKDEQARNNEDFANSVGQRATFATDNAITEASEQSDLNDSAIVLQQNELEFTFIEESWLEVSDKRGKKWSWQLYGPGEAVSFKGSPPYKIVVGNIKGTIVKYERQVINLRSFVDDNNVARVTIPLANR